jgi:hypothetical protein
VGRYLDPDAPLMVAVTGFDDRETLNRNLMYRYVASYEPYNFKGHLSDFPLTMAYGKQIDALRERYRDRVWDAEFRDNQGAFVTRDGLPYPLYSVLQNRAGKKTLVIVNEDLHQLLKVEAKIQGASTLRLARPESPEAVAISGLIEIPPRSAVIVMAD